MNTYDVAELARTLFEEAGDALFLFDPETEDILDVNPMAQRLCGFPRQQLLRLQATYLFRSEAPGGLQRLRNAFRKTGHFHSQEGFWLRHQDDGVWVPVNLTVTRLHAEPRTLGLITARDISERREAQALLQKKEAELRRIMASVSDCVWSADVDDKGGLVYRYGSRVVEKITGRPRDFFTGLPRWLSIVHPEDRPHLEQEARGVATIPAVREIEYRIVRPDGSVRWVRDNVAASRNDTGRVVQLDGILSDITERKQAE
jgi:PAS domain S-box-containing protein